MNNKLLSFLVVVIVILLGYIVLLKFDSNKEKLSANSVDPIDIGVNIIGKNKIFNFDNFHGSKNISKKFTFEYPENWINNGQYFSPEPIEYYDMFSVRAPFYFDLIRSDIFDQTEFRYQIDQSKRNSPDTKGKIDGEDFKRYDLIDYGSYGGESAGRVIIYIGPEITVDNNSYYLVFHWEEKPLTSLVSGNNPEIFEKVVKTLRFFK